MLTVLPLAVKGQILEVEGSYLRQLQERDSVLIADQLAYGFRLDGVPDTTVLAYPKIEEQLMENMITVSSWHIDTLRTHKVKSSGRKLYDIDSYIVIAPFEEGRYDLPRLSVLRATPSGQIDTLVFNPQTIDVTTIQIDTTTFVPHDIKGQIKYPITFGEILPYLLGFWVLALATIAIVSLIIIRRRKEEEIRFSEPAHITALRKLDKYRGDKYWEPDKQKVFYSGVTDALREYIAKRYGIGAMEMTTAEIFSDLKGSDVPDELFSEMKELFERADFVKFAKFVASREENATVLPQAVKFVTSTYQAEVEEEVDDQTADVPSEEKPLRREENNEDYMPK
mgnify:CR=1 FL=1